MILTDDPEIELFLGEDRFLARLQSYLDLASALRERVPEIDYVDLRFDDRIYVRRPPGRNARVSPRPTGAPGTDMKHHPTTRRQRGA